MNVSIALITHASSVRNPLEGINQISDFFARKGFKSSLKFIHNQIGPDGMSGDFASKVADINDRFINQYLSVIRGPLAECQSHRETRTADELKRYLMNALRLTGKHIESWGFSFHGDHDFTLVLEDDFQLRVGWRNQLDRLLGLFLEHSCDYLELCGHFSLNAMFGQASPAPLSAGSDWQVFKYFIPNTTCGYLISRRFVTFATETLFFNPDARLLHAGWLMNRIRLRAMELNAEMRGLHCHPGPIVNASLQDGVSSIV